MIVPQVAHAAAAELGVSPNAAAGVIGHAPPAANDLAAQVRSNDDVATTTWHVRISRLIL